MTTPAAVGAAAVEEFAGRALADLAGAMTTLLCAIGDRTGLTRELAAAGPVTSGGLALLSGVNERYTREWLRGMHAAGYLEYEPETRRFTLPAEHARVLADEGGPAFLGGAYQHLLGTLGPLPRLLDAFRDGGGVPQEAYGPDAREGMERLMQGWFGHLLLQEWLPALPEVAAKLEAGARLADVGCGGGRALLKLAKAYPDALLVGYDTLPAQLERARENAAAAGLDEERVRFEQLDAAEGLPHRFDVIMTFDVVQNTVDSRGLLRAIRAGLRDDGRYLLLEPSSADRLEDNQGPLATLFHGLSVLYRMPTSLASGGDGLGACGLPEAKVRELCSEAGFSAVRRVPIESGFTSLYEARA